MNYQERYNELVRKGLIQAAKDSVDYVSEWETEEPTASYEIAQIAVESEVR